MSIRLTALILIVAFAAPLPAQQHSFSGTSTCDVSVVHQTVTPDDEGDHSISLDQRVCRWQKPLVLAGVAFNDYTAYGTDDVQFNRSVDRGYAVGKSSRGDKYYLRYEGAAIMNGPVPQKLNGHWRFTGGAGRLRGLRGEGTYTAHPNAGGGMVFAITGTYRLATP